MYVHPSRPDLQGYEYREAVDGHEGVCLFETDGQFECVSFPSFGRLAIHSLYQCYSPRFINASNGR